MHISIAVRPAERNEYVQDKEKEEEEDGTAQTIRRQLAQILTFRGQLSYGTRMIACTQDALA